MGVTDQSMKANLFGEGVKKPDRSLSISKPKFFFFIFAVTTLQLADTVIIWLIGGKNASGDMVFPGDSIVFSAVVFGILKFIYDKGFKKRGQVCKEEETKDEDVEEPTENEEENFLKTATYVVDTMKVKGPPPSYRTRPKLGSKNQNSKPGCEATIWVSSWRRPQCLNPRAQKFAPLRTYGASMLKSDSPIFMPNVFSEIEKKLLMSQSWEDDIGEVLYRSNH